MKQLFFWLLLFSMMAGQAEAAESSQLNWIGHWKNEDKRELLVQEVKKEFEFLHPGVSVHFVYDMDLEDVPGENYKWKVAHTIVKMIRSGKITWDVVFLDVIVYDHVAELLQDPEWGKKYLVDFATVPGFIGTQKDFIVYDPSYRDKTGGILIGPYVEGLFYCFWFNRQVAARVGLTVRERNMSVADLLDYARKLAAYNRANGTSIPLIRLGTWNRIDTLFEYLFRSQFDDPQEAVSRKFSEKKRKAFLETLLIFEELSHYQPVFDENRKELRWDEWKNGFLEDGGLFITAGTFMYNHFQASGEEKYNRVRPAAYPGVKKHNGLVGMYTPVFGVMKDSPNKKAAIDLLMLWSEPKIAEKWVSYTRNPTGVKGHLSEPVFKAMTDDVYSRFALEMTELYSGMPMRYFQQPVYVFGEGNPVSATEFREHLALILEGGETARDYYESVMRRFRPPGK